MRYFASMLLLVVMLLCFTGCFFAMAHYGRFIHHA